MGLDFCSEVLNSSAESYEKIEEVMFDMINVQTNGSNNYYQN